MTYIKIYFFTYYANCISIMCYWLKNKLLFIYYYYYIEVFCVARNSVPKCHPSVLKRHILGQKTRSNSLQTEFKDGGHLVFSNGTNFKNNVARLRWCNTTLLSFKSIGESVFEQESRNQHVDGHKGGRQTHQYNRLTGYMQSTQI